MIHLFVTLDFFQLGFDEISPLCFKTIIAHHLVSFFLKHLLKKCTVNVVFFLFFPLPITLYYPPLSEPPIYHYPQTNISNLVYVLM